MVGGGGGAVAAIIRQDAGEVNGGIEFPIAANDVADGGLGIVRRAGIGANRVSGEPGIDDGLRELLRDVEEIGEPLGAGGGAVGVAFEGEAGLVQAPGDLERTILARGAHGIAVVPAGAEGDGIGVVDELVMREGIDRGGGDLGAGEGVGGVGIDAHPLDLNVVLLGVGAVAGQVAAGDEAGILDVQSGEQAAEEHLLDDGGAFGVLRVLRPFDLATAPAAGERIGAGDGIIDVAAARGAVLGVGVESEPFDDLGDGGLLDAFD